MAKKAPRFSVGRREFPSTGTGSHGVATKHKSSKTQRGKDTAKPPMHLLPIVNLAQAYDEVPVNGTSAPNIAELIRTTRHAEEQQVSHQTLDMRSRISSSRQRESSRAKGSPRSAPASVFSRSRRNPFSDEEEDIQNYSASATAFAGANQIPSKGPTGGVSVDKKSSLPFSSPQAILTPLITGGGSTSHPVSNFLSAAGSARGGMSGTITTQSSVSKRTAVMNGSHGTFNNWNSTSDIPSSNPGGFCGVPGSNSNGLVSTWNSSIMGSTTGNNTHPQPLTQGHIHDLSIVVGVRIRPFNRREVEELMNEKQRRKHNPALSASARLATTISRPKERQPFGPGREDIAGTLHSPNCGGSESLTLTSNGEVVGNPLENCELEILLDDHGQPLPVMEVLNDNRTLVLIDPLKQQGLTPDRSSKFTFDYVYSSFAPSVEIAGLDGTNSGYSHFCDTMESVSPLSSPVICGLEVDLKPEQELQAEREQHSIYVTLGLPLIDSALEGYNACIFAYGQTSSGKTYTMMGTKKHPGLIPRLCHELFKRVESLRDGHPNAASLNSIKIDVCYLEIYNEQVRDLLKQRPKNAILHYNSRFDTKDIEYQEYQTLKVRHHPERGVFVEGLTSATVASWADCERILRQGNTLRTQASTAMNATSSRSHAIFQLVITQSEGVGARVRGKQVLTHRVSKVNLVDLSGSERNSKAESMGKHLVEASNINASLSTLRRVLEAIISKKKVVPYRESLLTYVLSDNFGGNSKTVMCANVSPHAVNFAETDSTLRYATIARDVMNKVKVNDSPNSRLIRELKDRARNLQDALTNNPLSNAADANVVQSLEGEVRQYQERVQTLETKQDELVDRMKDQEDQNHKLMRALKKKKVQEEVWRKEAEKQRKHKEKLRQAFRLLVKAHPDMVQSVLFPDEAKDGAGDQVNRTGGMRFDEEDDSEVGGGQQKDGHEGNELRNSFSESSLHHDARPALTKSDADHPSSFRHHHSSKSLRKMNPLPSSSSDEEMMGKQTGIRKRWSSRHTTTTATSDNSGQDDPLRDNGSSTEREESRGVRHSHPLDKGPSAFPAAPFPSRPAARAVIAAMSSSGERENKYLQAMRSLQNYEGIDSRTSPAAKSDGTGHSRTSGSVKHGTSPDIADRTRENIPTFLPLSISSSIPSLSLPPISSVSLSPHERPSDPPDSLSSRSSPELLDVLQSFQPPHQPPPEENLYMGSSLRSASGRTSSVSSSQLRLGMELLMENSDKEAIPFQKNSKKTHRKSKSHGRSGGRNKKQRKHAKGMSSGFRASREPIHASIAPTSTL